MSRHCAEARNRHQTGSFPELPLSVRCPLEVHGHSNAGAYRHRKSTKEYIFSESYAPQRTNVTNVSTNVQSLLNRNSVSGQNDSNHACVVPATYDRHPATARGGAPLTIKRTVDFLLFFVSCNARPSQLSQVKGLGIWHQACARLVPPTLVGFCPGHAAVPWCGTTQGALGDIGTTRESV